MKKRFLAALTAVLALVLGLAVLSACGGGDSGVTISQTEVSLGVGDRMQLTATSGDGSPIEWTTSDKNVVSIASQVTGRGIVNIRAEGEGKATLTATNGSGSSATCEVTVVDYTVSLSGDGLTDGKITLLRKADLTFESKTLTATVLRSGEPSGEKVTWSSSDPETVSVNNSGVLTAYKITEEGSPVIITAKRAGGSTSAQCEVTVKWESVPTDWYQLAESGSAGAVENPGKWTWSGFQGTDDIHPNVTGEGFSDTNRLSLNVTGNTGWRWYGAQLFYKNPDLTAGTVYKFTFTLDSTTEGAITVNETDVEVKTGTQTVEVIYREAGGGEVSLSVALATHDKLHNNVNPIGQYKEGNLVISGMKWEVYAAQSLHAPTAFSVKEDGELVITDDNNDETFEGYIIGFFKDGAEEPSYTQPIMKPVAGRDILETMNVKDGKMYLDDSFVPDGTYTLKVKAYCGTALFAASPWSTATVSRTVAHEGGLEYDVHQSYRDVDRGIGRYYVWSEWNQYDAAGCYFKDDSLTLTLKGEASWYSNQVFFTSEEITPTERDNDGNLIPKLYEMTFTLSAKGAPDAEGNTADLDLTGRKFVVEGQIYDAVAGGEYTVRFLSTGSLTMFLGQPQLDNWDLTVGEGGLAAGVYTFENIKFKDASDPALHDVWFFGDNEGLASSADGQNKLMYWYAPIGDWAEWKATIDMREMSYTENQDSDTGYSYHFNYKITPIDNQVCVWIFRLWYKNPNVTNDKVWHVDLVINASEAGDILVNNEPVHLEAGEHTYTVYLNDAAAPLFISMATGTSMTGTSENGMDLTFKSINWEEGGKQALQAPTGVSVTDSGAVTFTDPNNKAGVDHYEVGFFQGSELISTQTFAESGRKIDESVLANGEYTVKVRFCGDKDHTDTDWVTAGTYTVTQGPDIALGGQSDAVAHAGKWYLWADRNWTGSTVTLTKTEADMQAKKLTVGYTTSGTPNLGYSVQLFYEEPANTTNKTYTLSIKIKLNVAGTITFNNKQYTFTAGEEKTIEVLHTEKGNGGEYNEGASLVILMGVYEGTPVNAAEITVSDWSFVDYVPKPGEMIPTELGEGEIPADSYWYYYSEYGTMTNLSVDAANGSISLHVGDAGNWYSNQIYYNSKDFAKDGTYSFSVKVHSSAAGKIRVNGKVFTLVAGDNTLEVESCNGMFSVSMGVPVGYENPETAQWGWGSDAASLKDCDVTFSEFRWTAGNTVYGLNGKIS